MEKKTKQEQKDRLTKLPTEITSKILALLPLNSAINTSILSQQWKSLWTQIDSLNIQFTHLHKTPNFNHILNQILLKLTSPTIRKLEVNSDDGFYHFCDLVFVEPFDGHWFQQICGGNVEEIVIRTIGSKLPKLPKFMFKINSLVSLKLVPGDFLINLADENGNFIDCVDFPCLKKLYVEKIRVSERKLLENLVKSCPLIEDLWLEFSQNNRYETRYDFSVCGENLKRMFIGFSFKGKIRVDAPNLERLTVDVCVDISSFSVESNDMALIDAQMNYRYERDEWCLLSAIFVANSSVRSFEMHCPQLGTSINKLSNITRLDLYQEFYLHSKFKNEFLQVLQCCPVLEYLVCDFRCILEKEEGDDDDLSGESPESIVPGCLLTHVKKIELNTRYIHDRVFKLIEFLLSKSRVLELLIFKRAEGGRQTDDQIDELVFCKEVYECQRSSSQCQIDFSGRHHRVPKEGGTVTDHVGQMTFLK